MRMPALIGAVVLAAGALACGPATPPDESRVPVLFVHGRGEDSSTFRPMISFLADHGYPRSHLLTIDLKPDTGPNAIAAERQIAPWVERELAKINERRARRGAAAFERIDLVTYSMGSVSGRWYAARTRPDRVRTWISLAGASHGTDIGCPWPAGSGSAELCPAFARSARESAVQFGLNGSPDPDRDETPYGLGADHPQVERVPPDDARRILYLTVRLPSDDYIGPVESTILDGAGGHTVRLHDPAVMQETSPGNFLLLAPSDHVSILSDRPVLEFILRALTSEPAPRA